MALFLAVVLEWVYVMLPVGASRVYRLAYACLFRRMRSAERCLCVPLPCMTYPMPVCRPVPACRLP